METFRDMFQICPKIPGQKFIDPLFEEEILTFLSNLGYPGNIKTLSEVKVEILPQPWRTFRTIINKGLSGKVTRLDLLQLSRDSNSLGHHQKNVDYVYLLWEDIVYQIKNKVSKRNKDTYYPRFTKIIINHFMSQDLSIPRRNKVDWHMASDDPILTTMRFIPQHEVVQKYDAILLDNHTNQSMKEYEAYKTYYAFATGKEIPKPKSGKKKQIAEGLETLSKIALSEAEQMKLAIERSKTQLHSSQPSGSDDKEEDSFDLRVQTPSHVGSTDDEDSDEEIQGVNVEGDDEEETNEEVESNELYRDVNVHLVGRDTEMTVVPRTAIQTTQILSRLKDVEMIMMKMKNPPLDQTGGQREVGLEKEPESTSAPKEKTSKSSGKSKEGSKSHQEHTGKSTQAEEPIHLMKGSCKSLVELEYFLEEVCKATIDKLDWNNPKGQQYPHDMRKPLPLIPNSRGRQVIPFEHFINNDLAYLSGGVSSRIYTTSVTKIKAADYGHIKSDLKRKEAYTACSSPRGFIYHNKDKKNRLMRIDELHKFSGGTLNDVRTALDDHLKGIRMKYLPQTIWRQSDRDKA
nr:hypothetical protein [Tanacetum cinerariifolium]